MKKSALAIIFLSQLSVAAFAQDEFQKYEAAVEAAKEEVAKALKSKDPKQISTAHYKLAVVQGEARKEGHVCDIAYLSSIVDNLQIAADTSPWFQMKLPSLPIYQLVSSESLKLQLTALGLVKGKPMSKVAFVGALQKIVATSDVTLYKPQPGIYPLGDIRFLKGTAIDRSLNFDLEGSVEEVIAAPVPAEVKLVNKKITIMMDGKARYRLSVERAGKSVENEVRSTDQIRIQEVGAEGSFEGQLFIDREECSA